MKTLVEKFLFQIQDAIKIGENAALKKKDKKIANVLITGLGGSGIGGKIVAQLTAKELTVPILINNDYEIPNFVAQHTLVVASSFSGNTEETLAALKIAEQKNAEIACITSGGKLLKIAQDKGYNHIVLPTERSPRAMLTYSLVQQFYMLLNYNLISADFKQSITDVIPLLEENFAEIKAESNKLA